MPYSPRIAMVGTYPPTQCGLATFTASLRRAMLEVAGPRRQPEKDDRLTNRPSRDEIPAVGVVRIRDDESADRDGARDGGLNDELASDECNDPSEVICRWKPSDRDSRAQSTGALHRFDLAILQHEFGIFGGDDGDEVLDFVAASPVPIVGVLHTVLQRPSRHQRFVLESLARACSRIVAQTNVARDRLLATCRVDPGVVVVIPHGAPRNFPCHVDTTNSSTRTILTWGLIGPGKGLERAIDAIAILRSVDPNIRYVIAGGTHPKVREASGEQYRDSLKKRAADLGVADCVVFDDGYRDTPSILRMVRESDVVLLPYDSREQVTSGVLVEAIASARPVVATAFPHAQELLKSGPGFVVDHDDTQAMADALHRVLNETNCAQAMSAAARREAAALLWPAVGARYWELARDVLHGARTE